LRRAVCCTIVAVVLAGCGKKEPFVPPPLPLQPGAQTDPLVPTDMNWRVMLRSRYVETPYGTFEVAMHRLFDIKVASQTPPGPDQVVTTLLGCRYQMDDGTFLVFVFELKWIVTNVTWDEAAEGKKFVVDSDYTVKSLRVISVSPAA
jgi:hypothetical protein